MPVEQRMLSWFFTGEEYHRIKEEWKKVRETLAKLKFAGFQTMAWYDMDQRIELIANREKDERGVEYNKDVRVIWRGREKTALAIWMEKEWAPFAESDGLTEEEKVRRAKLREVYQFDCQTKYRVDEMMQRNAPASFIGYYKHDRELLRTILMAEYHVICGTYDNRDLEIVKEKVNRKLKGRGPRHL